MNITSSIEFTIFLQCGMLDEKVDVVGELKSSLVSLMKSLIVNSLGAMLKQTLDQILNKNQMSIDINENY